MHNRWQSEIHEELSILLTLLIVYIGLFYLLPFNNELVFLHFCYVDLCFTYRNWESLSPGYGNVMLPVTLFYREQV